MILILDGPQGLIRDFFHWAGKFRARVKKVQNSTIYVMFSIYCNYNYVIYIGFSTPEVPQVCES